MNMTVAERQDCVRQFVGQHVFDSQTMLIDDALRLQLFSWDDVYNLYRPFNCKLQRRNACSACEEPDEALDGETGECKKCFEKNQQAQDIYEWWLVSEWLERKLKEQCEPILDNAYGSWWGRTCSGQAIYLDGVINKIYDDAMIY